MIKLIWCVSVYAIMSFHIYEYSIGSYIFLNQKYYFPVDSQEYILLCNRCSEICESGIAKMPLRVIIVGTPTWRMIYFGTDESDCTMLNVPHQIDENGDIVPYLSNECTVVKFEHDSDTTYEFGKCTSSRKTRLHHENIIANVPEIIETFFTNLND
jgi:hypothetical protein